MESRCYYVKNFKYKNIYSYNSLFGTYDIISIIAASKEDYHKVPLYCLTF